MEKEEKKVIAAGAYPQPYEVYDDGSLGFQCKDCKSWIEKTSDEAAKFTDKESWASTFDFLCGRCWKKQGAATTTHGTPIVKPDHQPRKDDINERIAYAQSWNLAVALLAPRNALAIHKSIAKEEIEEWQRYFYGKLTNH